MADTNELFEEYKILNFKLTQFKDIFPIFKEFHSPLGNDIPPSNSSINIAKAYIHLLTKIQFRMYLEWQYRSLPETLHNNYSLKEDIKSYKSVLNDYSQWLDGETKRIEKFDDEKYNECLSKFDKDLESYVKKEMFSQNAQKVYNFFFENYEFFHKVAYGFLPKVEIDGEEYYSYKNKTHQSWKKNKHQKSLQSLLAEAGRVYPVIRVIKNEVHLILCSYAGNNEDYEWSGWVNPYYIKESSDSSILTSIIRDSELSNVRIKEFTKIIDIKDNEDGSFYFIDKDGKKISIPKVFDEVGMHIEISTNNLEKDESISVKFKPIDHDMILLGETEVLGLPMWDDLPFEVIKKSIVKNN